jgi:hypothetical protein
VPTFYRDRNGDALAEYVTVQQRDRYLAAHMLGLSGTEVEGEDSPHCFHYDAAHHQTLFLVTDRNNGIRAYLFYRKCLAAPSPWQVVAVGIGEPDDNACTEALRRFLLSYQI